MKKLVFLLFITLNAFANDSLKVNKFQRFSTLGIGLGSSHYFGDIHPYSIFDNQPSFFFTSLADMPCPNMAIRYNHYFNRHFSLQTSLNWIRITADDEKYANGNERLWLFYIRNLHFRNDIKELNTVLKFYKNVEKRTSFYYFAGLSLYAHNPKARAPYDEKTHQLGKWVALRELKTSGQAKPYSLLGLAIPFGLGVQQKLKSNFVVSLDLTFRYNTNDNLDDIIFSNYPAIGKGNEVYSNRMSEDFSAFSGKSRIEVMKDIYSKYLYINDFTKPSDRNVLKDFPPIIRRGHRKKDTYLTTNLSISYILKSKKKH